MDYLDDEMEIMAERENEDKATISLATFKESISTLRLPNIISLGENASIAEAVKTMQENKIGSVLVIQDNKLTGILTERDILMKVVGKIDDLNAAKVSDVMTADPTSLMKTDVIAHIMHNMQIGGYRHVPIVDENGAPLSIVSIKDIMSLILDHIPEEVLNVSGEPYRGPVSREGA